MYNFLWFYLLAGSSANNDEQITNEQEKNANTFSEEIENNITSNDNCGDEDSSISAKEQLSVEEKEKDSADEDDLEKTPPELVNFRVVWNKKSYDVQFDVDLTVDQLKEHIQGLTGLQFVNQNFVTIFTLH